MKRQGGLSKMIIFRESAMMICMTSGTIWRQNTVVRHRSCQHPRKLDANAFREEADASAVGAHHLCYF
jgi:hypothetical protein